MAAKNDPKTKYISVPSDNNLSSLPCPICQEKFDTSWNDEVQDWVWMDAEKIGSRVYHASCYAEFKKDKGDSPSRRDSTPDSVLGKRKAEVSIGWNFLPNFGLMLIRRDIDTGDQAIADQGKERVSCLSIRPAQVSASEVSLQHALMPIFTEVLCTKPRTCKFALLLSTRTASIR